MHWLIAVSGAVIIGVVIAAVLFIREAGRVLAALEEGMSNAIEY